MIRLVAATLAVLLAISAPQTETFAQTTEGGDEVTEREWLFEVLRTAPTERLGRVIEDQIWWYWMRQAPDEESAAMMRQAMERREAYDYAGALEIADDLVERAPGWAAAWNERATILFLQEKYEQSLEDVARTLELEPKHFGALAGKALIYFRQGRAELAQKALRRAVAIHPWLKERHMLPTEPAGEKT